MIDVKENNLHIVQDGLENKIQIYLVTLNPTSWCHWEGQPPDNEQKSNKDDFRSDVESDENQWRRDDSCVVSRIVWRAGRGPHVWYLVRWYGYEKVIGTT